MFIVYPTNVDYLIPSVRMRVGDYDGSRFSDSLIRTALINGIKGLQRRWNSRYLVFDDAARVSPLPDGYIYETDIQPDSVYTSVVPSGYVLARTSWGYATVPSGIRENDVYRNPYAMFSADGPPVIAQEDETPIILVSSIMMRTAQITSSAETFQSWSDGEYSFSNIASSRALVDMRTADVAELELYFKQRLSGPLRSQFADILPALN